MTAQKAVMTELMVLTDRPSFLEAAGKTVGEPDGVRVASLEGSPRKGALNACMAVLQARSSSIILIDTDVEPDAALDLVREICDRQPAARVLISGGARDPDLILRSQRAGASEFLPSPLERKALLDSIHRIWRRLAPEAHGTARRRGQVFPFLCTKGGCGATTVATNLAVSLARRGHSTLLLDLDLSAGDVALLLNLQPTFSVVDVVQNLHRLDRELFSGMTLKHASGLEILPARENLDQAAAVGPAQIAQVLKFMKEQFDCVVINTRNATDALAQAAVNEADLVHVVSCLDLLSLRRAQWALHRMAQSGVSRDLIRLVISRYEKNPYISLEEAEKLLDLKIAWTIPADPRTVHEALNEGVPFVIRSRNGLHGCFESYAGGLIAGGDAGKTPPGRRGLLGLFGRSAT
jgi:pilus assembly protein CpaE